MMLRGFSYRHRDAKVGRMAMLECADMFIFDTAAETAAYVRANCRDPQDFVIISGPVNSLGGGRSRLTPDSWSEVGRG